MLEADFVASVSQEGWLVKFSLQRRKPSIPQWSHKSDDNAANGINCLRDSFHELSTLMFSKADSARHCRRLACDLVTSLSSNQDLV